MQSLNKYVQTECAHENIIEQRGQILSLKNITSVQKLFQI